MFNAENIDTDAMLKLADKIDRQTSGEDASTLAMALAIVAARRARRAGGSSADFSEACGAAWGLSVER